jgi:exodeoxyribonuclease VII small subunit
LAKRTTGESNSVAAAPANGADCATFEQSLAELEAIVHDLEEGQIGLAESLARYEAGIQRLKHCYSLLQQAERKIELLTGINEGGAPETEPFASGNGE